MLEWLEGDPLNGIAITITFFISLVIGRHFREKRNSQEETRGNIIDTRLKILLSFLLIISITLMKNWYIPAAVSFTGVFAAVGMRKLSTYSGKIILPLVLGLFILIIQALTNGTQTVTFGPLTFYSEGIEYGVLVFSRVVASASVLILLIITTRENELIESMQWFRAPPTLLQIMSFMVRYIKTFSHEGAILKQAQQSRCGFPNKSSFLQKIRNIAAVGGLLIMRAFLRGDDVYRAMISRGWKPDIKSGETTAPLNRKDLFTGIVLFSGIIALIGIDMVI
ncbi:MAG: cobalt ECF transporter T component CbiQ [Candidatus Methanoperedens sp.]|nr:cobalt ECF transporter T component CbiQ [Candidatus Methanoperedens sp.]